LKAELVLDAPCKVNLGLTVLGRRPDGFHELDTVMAAVDRVDRLTLTLRDRRPGEDAIGLEVSGPQASPDVPTGPENLVWRAASRVLAEEGDASALRVELALEKHVPSRAGLGGGSSDAAACMAGLATLLGWSDGDPRIGGLLAELGSDTVFFHAARASGWARCRGRGELVEPLAPLVEPLPWCVVVTPDVDCATGRVYEGLDPGARPGPGEPQSDVVELLRAGRLEAAGAAIRNDLEAPALAAHPRLRPWRKALAAVAPDLRLAGSGASWFSLAAGEGEALHLLGALEEAAGRADLRPRASFAAPLRARGVAPSAKA